MRIRIKFCKTEAMRYTGHLDLHKAWERAIRRAQLPLAYSQGFHPQPKINLACALPLGMTSECELVDIWLESELPVEAIQAQLIPALPPGIRLIELQTIEGREPALQTQVTAAEYVITFLDPVADLAERVEAVKNSPSLPRTRRNKNYDLRPLVEMIDCLLPDEAGLQRVQVRLAARESATGRPEEFVDALGLDAFSARYQRTALILNQANQPERVEST
jgi:radical SAM-linked protein